MVSVTKWVIAVCIFISSETVNSTEYRLWVIGAKNKDGERSEKVVFMNSCSIPLFEKCFETFLTEEQIQELSSTQHNMGDVEKNLYYACPVEWLEPNTWFQVSVTKMLMNQERRLVITYNKMLPVSQATVIPIVAPVQEFWITFSSKIDPTKSTTDKYLVTLGNNGSSERKSWEQNWSIQLSDQLVQDTGNGTLIFKGIEYEAFLYDAVTKHKSSLKSEYWKRIHIENILPLHNGKNQVFHIDFFILGREVWLLFDSKEHRGKQILCHGLLYEKERKILPFHPVVFESSNNLYLGRDQISKKSNLLSQLKLENIKIQRKVGPNDEQPHCEMWESLNVRRQFNTQFFSREKNFFIHYESF